MKYPYEIHITVQNTQLLKFLEVCHRLTIKPLVIDLENSNIDVMTAIKTNGTFQQSYGLIVIREKIETVPDNPQPHILNGYYECHYDIKCNDNLKNKLLNINNKLNLGLFFSKNVNKGINDEYYYQIATYRSTNLVDYNKFKQHLDYIEKMLNIPIEKKII